MRPGLIPSEAWDETHPDHDDWVRSTGRCYADHDHTRDTPTDAAQGGRA